MRAVLVFALLSSTAAGASPIAMTMEDHGSAIALKFTNQTKTELKLPIRIMGSGASYDWLVVRLKRGKDVRDLHFALDRDESWKETVKLAPGAATTETIDLAAWAVLGTNGEPLEPGDYDIEAKWNATRETPSFEQTATGKLRIAAPVEGECKDASHDGLAVLARQVGQSTVIEVGLHNIDKVAHCVHSRVKAGGIQSDWLTVTLPATSRSMPRVLRFVDARERSIVVSESLAPGATTWVRFDLQDWAKRKGNDGKPIAADAYYPRITYDARSEKGVWNGTVSTQIVFVVR